MEEKSGQHNVVAFTGTWQGREASSIRQGMGRKLPTEEEIIYKLDCDLADHTVNLPVWERKVGDCLSAARSVGIPNPEETIARAERYETAALRLCVCSLVLGTPLPQPKFGKIEQYLLNFYSMFGVGQKEAEAQFRGLLDRAHSYVRAEYGHLSLPSAPEL